MCYTQVYFIQAMEPLNTTTDVMERGQNPALTLGVNTPRTAWCFTLNNYTEDEAQDAMDWAEANCAYVVFGWELAPTTYIPHIQGYFRVKRGQTLRYLRWTSLRASS